MNPPRPLWKSVQDYVMIAIGMISYAIGWNVFLLPTNVTASGLMARMQALQELQQKQQAELARKQAELNEKKKNLGK